MSEAVPPGEGPPPAPEPPSGEAAPPAAASFFASRWVERPSHVHELPGGLPAGFRAAGVAAGVKPSGRPDVGLLVSEAPGTISAARFTRSATQAPPVLLTRERCSLERLRAVAVNAGNANCATGSEGLEAAARMQAAGARLTGVPAEHVAVCSTGVIGVPLDIDAVERGLEEAAGALRGDGDEALTRAMCTTDAFAKHASLEVQLPSGAVRLSAQAKGAGMIAPAFSATLLCFVECDAALEAETADLLLGVCVKRSFDRISVDGQLSTNDAAILLCSGASGVQVAAQTDDELRLGEALDALLRQLALMVARDGEGAERVGLVAAVEAVARAVADSPLVKTALHGADPNWGRIVQAVGAALPGAAPLPVDVDIEGIAVCRAGVAVPHDHGDLARRVRGREVEYVVAVPGEGAETEVFFSDLGHEYVRINAEYTT